ncbi:hypothetical protein LCGC14_2468900 [marine sediment metagenome]|uniref:Rubredoxin-like domain-containing protein n=1 Tax=marine sediment metagenome TaxID=412755 RepID=A0A0F9BBL0_9ZZZZ
MLNMADSKLKVEGYEYGPWRLAYQCLCGKYFHWRVFRDGLIPSGTYPPSVCPDCGRAKETFTKGAGRTVSEVTHSRFLGREQLRLIKHEWTVYDGA